MENVRYAGGDWLYCSCKQIHTEIAIKLLFKNKHFVAYCKQRSPVYTYF